MVSALANIGRATRATPTINQNTAFNVLSSIEAPPHNGRSHQPREISEKKPTHLNPL